MLSMGGLGAAGGGRPIDKRQQPQDPERTKL